MGIVEFKSKSTEDRIGCEIESLSYDFTGHSGAVFTRPLHYTDMTGTIEFFEQIDPHVQSIMVSTPTGQDRYSDYDTVSYRRGKDAWIALKV